MKAATCVLTHSGTASLHQGVDLVQDKVRCLVIPLHLGYIFWAQIG
jgi:Rad3-related DNA helicase